MITLCCLTNTFSVSAYFSQFRLGTFQPWRCHQYLVGWVWDSQCCICRVVERTLTVWRSEQDNGTVHGFHLLPPDIFYTNDSLEELWGTCTSPFQYGAYDKTISIWLSLSLVHHSQMSYKERCYILSWSLYCFIRVNSAYSISRGARVTSHWPETPIFLIYFFGTLIMSLWKNALLPPLVFGQTGRKSGSNIRVQVGVYNVESPIFRIFLIIL